MRQDTKRRPATVAGSFYESDPGALKKDLLQMLALSHPNKNKMLAQAIVVPHAGYIFSGNTAAKTFKTAADGRYENVLILAPSHYCPFSGLSYSSFESYQTPIGDLNVDMDSINEIISKENPWIDKINLAHKEEHSLEVELPFIQTLFPEAKIIPFLCGRIDEKIADRITETLYPLFRPSTLWVVSSDFTHFGSSFGYTPFSENIPDKIKSLDMGAIGKILEIDYHGFSQYLDRTGATICGGSPLKILLKTAMKAVAEENWISPELIDYTNSGELTGDYSNCVSYAGITFYIKK